MSYWKSLEFLSRGGLFLQLTYLIKVLETELGMQKHLQFSKFEH